MVQFGWYNRLGFCWLLFLDGGHLLSGTYPNSSVIFKHDLYGITYLSEMSGT